MERIETKESIASFAGTNKSL